MEKGNWRGEKFEERGIGARKKKKKKKINERKQPF